jgi:hypothetical protein
MESDNEQGKHKTFQVVDKRRFDAAGQERTSEQVTTHSIIGADQPAAEAAAATTDQADAAKFTMTDAPRIDEPEPVAFTSFIMSLATQVLVQLGEMPPPSGMEIPIDLESARQTIDIMSMLQKRTRGNLSADEARFMEDVLHSLRMSYVNATKKAG